MYLKRRTRRKDGKTHVQYAICESLRVSASRVIQRTVLHLGELNTTQLDRWQRTIEVLHEDGQGHQLRLFTDREGHAPAAPDVVEVRLSTLRVKQPRRFGDCWVGTQLWEQLGLRAFWQEALGDQAGQVPWHKVLELLAVNRLLAPRSELFVHERWFGQTAMEILLDTTAEVADKDRLYRCLDRLLEHKEGWEAHLSRQWKDLFGATYDVLLYDLTSTYFEGQVPAQSSARVFARSSAGLQTTGHRSDRHPRGLSPELRDFSGQPTRCHHPPADGRGGGKEARASPAGVGV